MKAMILAAAMITLTVAAGSADSQPIKGEVRSPSGKLLYKTKTDGNRTEVRSSTGKLLMKSTTKEGKTEVRSPTGKLLYKTK